MNGFSGWLLRAWYSPRPIWFFIPLAWLFWLLSSLRRATYGLGVLQRASLPAPVIVVGNVSVGGTGKTLFVIWLAAALTQRGYKAGIISRGYGGKARQPMLVTPDSDPGIAGDEAVLLARRTGLPVAVCRDRAAAALMLCSRYPIDVLLSDDGLQHYRLPRDLEIVLLDGDRGLGNGWLLPAGPLRETEHRLDEADITVIKRSGAGQFTWPGAIYMPLLAETAVSLADGRRMPLAEFAGRSVHALAGIGNPEQFFATLAAAGMQVDGRALTDHTSLTPADLQFADDKPVFMTEKDAVKCRSMALPRHWYVEASAHFAESDQALILERMERCMAERRPRNP
ncbi:MAG TPA: tetraacyldisaccharide 4'-kinase [Gammaproteobacteria bacterium]|jgi:tetraacyldisaccharide 4'-kinase|nr:tetraacyldisaccharide 4'-kinase [Gammaproteobacteria bacterium]